MKIRLLLIIVSVVTISTTTAISFAQRSRDNAEKLITGEFKITIKSTVAGNTSQSTTMIKGMRQRDESSMSMGGMNQTQVNITQCDLKRTIQINDSSRKYIVTPMAMDDADAASGGGPAAGAPAQRGGVVMLIVNTVDTGERKEMFGFNARHLKRTTIIEPAADACSQQKMKIENDGWYINLEYGLACETSGRPPMGPMAAPGCRNRYQYRRTGPTNLGFPLVETTTMYGADGGANFTMAKEVLEISRQPLDAALFEIPAGYTQAGSQQEMYGAPSMDQIMAQAKQQTGESAMPAGNPAPAAPSTNAAPKAKVGVVEFNNKAKASVSTDSLRQQLISVLNGSGIDAVELNASSASEAALEAKAKGCTYILYTDISTFKAASSGKKLGGFLGRAAGVNSGESGKSEAKLDFRLVAVDGGAPKLQSSASGKEDNSESSVNAALQAEARAVTSAVGGH